MLTPKELDNAVFVVKSHSFPFLSVPFELCHDESISHEARGLLLWMLYMTEHCTLESIPEQHQAAFDELVKASYVIKKGQNSWIVYEDRQN
jgi:hypothetical protein